MRGRPDDPYASHGCVDAGAQCFVDLVHRELAGVRDIPLSKAPLELHLAEAGHPRETTELVEVDHLVAVLIQLSNQRLE